MSDRPVQGSKELEKHLHASLTNLAITSADYARLGELITEIGKAVASVVGIGGMAGAASGMIIAKVVSYVLQFTGSYRIPFLLAGCAYLIALAVIHALAPKLKPVAL